MESQVRDKLRRPKAATQPQEQPDDTEPTPERQAELRAAYEANIAQNEAPYAHVKYEREANCSGSCESGTGQAMSSFHRITHATRRVLRYPSQTSTRQTYQG